MSFKNDVLDREDKTMEKLVKTLWRKTLKPVYEHLVGRYVQAVVNRLDSISTRLDELDGHVRTMLAAGWENAALERRMAALEDRLDREGLPAAQEPEREPADAR